MRQLEMMLAKSRTSLLAVVVLAASLAVTMGLAADAQAGFGVAAFDQQIVSASGGSFTQAGGHPYEIKTEIDLNSFFDPELGANRPETDAKDVIVELPPGLFGNPAGLPQCTMAQLLGPPAGAGLADAFKLPECPISSQVGTIQLRTAFSSGATMMMPLYNMVPATGMPATFGFLIAGVPITLSGNIRNGGDFGVNVGSFNIPIALPLAGITTTFWGTPADKSHDFQRCDWAFFGFFEPENPGEEPGCQVGGEGNMAPHADPVAPTAFLTIPTSCTPPGVGLQTTVRSDPWLQPGEFSEKTVFNHLAPGYPLPEAEWGAQVASDGCDFVPFHPSIGVEPTNSQADTPTGLNVDISLPQEGLLNPAGIATADVKKAVVSLPAGESISPSAADGLGACSLAQVGLNTGKPAACPDSSKLGSVQIDTPLLEDPLQGAIYLAKQNENPFGSLLALYIVVEGHGVILKLPGRVDLDPVTGQIVTTFDNNPQLPFDHLKLNFKAGPRSPLVNPHECGTYRTTAVLTPWSGNPPAEVSGSFTITSGPNGSPCPGSPQAFTPGFAAGTVNNQAGAFSPFSLTFTRADGEQQLGGVTMKLPPGLLGTLSNVPLCQEPAASQGTCASASEIGSVVVAAGAGANPFYVTGGKIFLTGPYGGAPFGLSVAVPAKAGPLDLGTVIVRGTVSVDPHTADLTVTTDPLPTILDGIPLDLHSVHVSIDKQSFIFNPTNCDPMSLTGTLTGGAGATDPVANSFQVTNCRILAFKPSFTVSTNGKTSRANGASLDVNVAYPPGSMGKQANIAKVKVELPRQLPSRLETLQKACVAEVFESDPARCPAASKIGTAVVQTQVVPVPLTGPMYFVSHGGQAFPDLVIVLQGYGVTIDIVGNTFISKAGITSTTFHTVPDVPFETFELKLPQGRTSALAANGDLCASSLRMPTLLVAQDAEVIQQSTPIAVSGCKARLRVLSSHGNANKVTVVASAPSAGRLSASAKGLISSGKDVAHAGTVSLQLKLTGGERRFLARRPGRRLKVSVRLVFAPRHGAAISGSVVVLVG